MSSTYGLRNYLLSIGPRLTRLFCEWFFTGRRSCPAGAVLLVRLCYYAVVRTTLDISDEAYYLAKAIAQDQNRSLGRVVGDLILQSVKGAKTASITMSDYGFPNFRCSRTVTTEDVKALDDEE